jgi:hypothetical protein
MEKEFIPYEQALALEELGFDEPCFGRYYYKELYPMLNPNSGETELVFEFGQYVKQTEVTILAPLYQQAFRWFRDKYNLRGFIGFRPNVKQFDYHIYDMSLSGKEYVKQRTMEEFNKDPKVGTYEEAELECLKKLIEAVKNKQG